MARTKISEFSATAADNTDIDNIDIAEGCAPSGINNAIREMMAQLKDFQTGAAGDSFNGPVNGALNGSLGATTPNTVVATQVDITAQGDLRLQDTTGGQYVALQAPGTVASSYTLTLPVDDGTAGQALITDGSGVLSWSSAASGDVYGPASATDNAVARYDGTTGKLIQNSAVTIADDGATVIDANSTTNALRITQTGTGNALLVEDSANPDATPFVVNADGNVIIGGTTALGTGLSLVNSGSFTPVITSRNTTADSGYTYADFQKSRAGAIVQSGDGLGGLIFSGFDGAAQRQASSIVGAVDGTPGTNDMPGRLVFSTTADGASSPTEAMRIDNQRRVGIGATPFAGSNIFLGKTITGAVTSYGFYQGTSVQSDVTSGAIGYMSSLTTQAAAFTLPSLIHYRAAQSTLGAGSTVTNQYGFEAASSLTGATNNYGFYSNIASGTGRWNFYAAGTAANVFAGQTSIGGTPGAESLRVTPVASAVNYWNAAGAVTGANPYLQASGSDTNIGFTHTTKGNGAFYFTTNNFASLQFLIAHTASAVNYLQVTGGATGSGATLSAQGSDANIDLNITAKGTNSTVFRSGGGAQFAVANTASAVNFLRVTGSATGGSVSMSALGSDTNIDLALTPKGTGVLRFGTHTASADVAISGYIEIKDAAGNIRKLAVIS